MNKSKKLIFVVDDDPVIRDSLESYLIFRGFIVRAMDDGMDVIQMCRHFLPDLIISDIRMPRLDGISLLQGLREKEKTKDIPVILMSAYTEDEIVKRAQELGAEFFIFKPFTLPQLDEYIEKIFVEEYKYIVE